MRYYFFASLLIGFISLTSTAQAQYADRAFDFSRSYQNGSARTAAMGGGKAAIGGDISSMLYNPAGLGFYRRSEASMSLGFRSSNASTDYLSNNTDKTSSFFSVPQIGVVINNSLDDLAESDFRGGSFAISLEKINDFNSTITYSGVNAKNDILDFYLQNDKNGGFYTDLAYDAYLLDRFAAIRKAEPKDTIGIVFNRIFPSDSPSDQYPVNQSETIENTGSTYRWNFAYGGNLNDVFFFGAGVALDFLEYKQVRTYRENYTNSLLESHFLTQTDEINGAGLNLTLGAIYKPVDELNIGLSFSSPTVYWLNEKFNADMTAHFESNAEYQRGQFVGEDNVAIANRFVAKSDKNKPNFKLGSRSSASKTIESTWTLYTPMKARAGIAYFIEKSGFITADIEWVNYNAMKVESVDFESSQDNKEIRQTYKNAINYSIGGEYRYDVLRFRAGFAKRSNPNKQGVDLGTRNFSVGAGIRQKLWYTDLAIITTRQEIANIPYKISDGSYQFPGQPDWNLYAADTPVAHTTFKDLSIRISGGFFF